MSVKDFLKRCLMEYFIITTCVTAAMAVLGQALDPTAQFGYQAFWSPLLFGLIGLVPSVVTYSSKELPFRQALLRKVLQVAILEAGLISFGFWAGILYGVTDASFFALTVLAVYFAVDLISWKLAKRNAGEINRMLRALQDNERE